MVVTRLAAALLVTLALAAGASSSSSAAGGTPTGLRGFLLRADEPPRDTFPRTPAFAWNPVPGAVAYDFQLATSSTFRQNGMVFEQHQLQSPVAAPPLTLPWISGSPHALYARVRGVLNTGETTPWSDSFGFDMTAPAPPTPLAGSAGLIRWSPVEGADGYEVWLIDANKKEQVYTNVLDERDFYTFHQTSQWMGAVRWRIRAIRADLKGRLNGLPVTQYGKWSPIYSSSNPDMTTGPLMPVATVSDVVSNGSPTSPSHRFMPAFTWTGNQASDGTSAELYRVYVFTDKQCINRVFTSAIVGSPAYAPRPYGPLSLPVGSVSSARSVYLPDGAEPTGYTYDGEQVSPSESVGQATPTTALPAETTGSSSGSGSGTTGTGNGSASGTLDWGGSLFGAPVDLWDTEWPQGGYYWTVIPVAAVSPGALLTNVASPGSPATATSVPVTQSDGFASGDSVTVGNVGNAESAVITSVSATSLTFASALKFNHGAGEPILRTGGSLRYTDMEMAQDVCAAGRVARFGKDSEPSLISSGDLFASGLSPTGRLTSAVHTASFYRPPLVSWTPALGALAYEVQWSKSRYPFDPSSGGKTLIGSTSYVLPLTSGTWYYRVRGYDYWLPTGSQQMSWSDPAKIVVTKPTFTIVSGGTPAKATAPKAATKPAAKKAAPAAAYRRWTFGTLSVAIPSTWRKEPPSKALFSAYDPAIASPRSGLAVLLAQGRNGRSFDQWAKDLAALMQAAGAIGTAKATVVAEPAGKAVWVTGYRASPQGPLNTTQVVFDGGTVAYDLVLIAPQSKDAKYVPILRHAAQTFSRG